MAGASEAHEKEYASFRSNIPVKVVTVGDGPDATDWRMFEYGPRTIKCPLLLLPPACGSAEVYYKQVMSLGAHGLRVIAVDFPVFWDVDQLVSSFIKLLDQLMLDQIHLFGAALGGFVAQKVAEATANAQRVQSLILCLAFSDTAYFRAMPAPSLYPFMPTFVMKHLVLSGLLTQEEESDVVYASSFILEQLDAMPRRNLASRLSLNTKPNYVEPQKISQQNIAVMLIDVLDAHALSAKAKEEIMKLYPESRVAHLKSGGDLPFLSRSDEVNMYIKIHLRAFRGTRYTAGDAAFEAVPPPAAAASGDAERPAASGSTDSEDPAS